MRFLILGDLHGKEPKIFYSDFDAIISPGDFCSDNLKKYMFKSLKENTKNSTNVPWYKSIGEKKAKELIKESISDGRKVLKKLNSFNVPVYIVPGNWDWTKDEISEWVFLKKDNYSGMIRGLKNIKDVHNKILTLGGYQIIGYGINSGPEYPIYEEDFKTIKPRELAKIKRAYERNSERISLLFRESSKQIIFLSHNVPFNTKLDRINNRKSPRNGYHYGSLIVREVINKYQPLVNIAGHMHENFGRCKIGKTVCINAGHGNNVNTLMEIKEYNL